MVTSSIGLSFRKSVSTPMMLRTTSMPSNTCANTVCPVPAVEYATVKVYVAAVFIVKFFVGIRYFVHIERAAVHG